MVTLWTPLQGHVKELEGRGEEREKGGKG